MINYNIDFIFKPFIYTIPGKFVRIHAFHYLRSIRVERVVSS